MSHQTKQDYIQTLQIIKEMGRRQRVENYLINCGKMTDVIKSELENLHKREMEHRKKKDHKFMADYIKGKRHGLTECIRLLGTIWECQNPEVL